MSSQGNTSLCFITWNTHGIRSPPEKFSNVLHILSELHADIVFIQETRVGADCYQILTDVKDWKVYFTVHSSSSKGVAILIKNSVPFKYICHDEDCSGGYIVLFCHLYGELYTLVNVYNHKRDRFVLPRLKDYLMETAEGVLVVGGDFNTVLHPCFDRSSSASRHSPFRVILEDFTLSLNLRDTWSYLNFADEDFTRHQNDSHSRIDMFFMRNDALGRARNISIEHNDISDHDPVVMNLEVKQQTDNKFPKVAMFVKEFHKRRSNKISGKISGAEILYAIRALAHSQEQRSDQRPLSYYKRRQCPVTEILKIKYNKMLKKTENVSEFFKKSDLSQGRHIFNVEYLIFSQILSKRLSAYIFPNFNEKLETNPDKFINVTLEKCTQKIKLSFLQTICAFKKDLKMKLSPFAPPAKFHILEHLLPVQGSFEELRLLRPGCPLTNTILNLALNELVSILNSETECRSCVCFQRQALLIHAHPSKQEQVENIVEKFQEDSGIILMKKKFLK